MKKRTLIVLLLLSSCVAVEAQTFSITNDEESGRLTLMEGEKPVYSFQYKPQLKEGVNEKYRRSGYFHPIYDLDGQPITDDFPDDHYHHRGMWLSWPWMKYRGKKVQLWHPSPLKQEFDRVVDHNLTRNRARIILRNNWVLNDQVIGREEWIVTTYARRDNIRVIDIQITAGATEEPITVRGKQNNDKGYGGLTIRAHPSLKGAQLLTSKGARDEDATNETFQWADISSDKRGLALLVHPSNPNSPQPWLLRHSYAGLLNPEWPGLESKTLEPGKPLELKYRLVVHKGRISSEQIQKLFETGAW